MLFSSWKEYPCMTLGLSKKNYLLVHYESHLFVQVISVGCPLYVKHTKNTASGLGYTAEGMNIHITLSQNLPVFEL